MNSIFLRYELGREYKAIKKLNKLESYLSNDLEIYQDVVKGKHLEYMEQMH